MGLTSAFGDVDDAVNLRIFGGKGKNNDKLFWELFEKYLKTEMTPINLPTVFRPDCNYPLVC